MGVDQKEKGKKMSGWGRKRSTGCVVCVDVDNNGIHVHTSVNKRCIAVSKRPLGCFGED